MGRGAWITSKLGWPKLPVRGSFTFARNALQARAALSRQSSTARYKDLFDISILLVNQGIVKHNFKLHPFCQIEQNWKSISERHDIASCTLLACGSVPSASSGSAGCRVPIYSQERPTTRPESGPVCEPFGLPRKTRHCRRCELWVEG